jgi:putative ABC transport system permease protein
MFVRMLRQSFLRGRRRKVLAMATIVISAGLISALMTISIHVGDKMSRELKSYGANINLVPKSESIPLEIAGVDYNPLRGKSFLSEGDLPAIKEIFWRNNIVGFAPFLKSTVRVSGNEKPVTLIGTWFDRPTAVANEADYRTGVRAINPFWRVDGSWPSDAADAGVLVGAGLAETLNIDVGERLRVNVGDNAGEGAADLQVIGLLKTGGSEDQALVAPLAMVQRLTGLVGKVQAVSVSALTVPENALAKKARRDLESLNTEEYDRWYCTAYVSTIAHQIEEAVPGSTARPIWQVAASEGAVMGKIQLLLLVVTVAAFISSSLGIASLMSTTIMERSGEIGLMKALGAADWEIYLLFLAEAAVVGAAGGLAGCAVGAALAQVISLGIFGSTVPFAPVTLPVIVFTSVLIALAGSLAPSRHITRLLPAEVLHGR